MVRPPPEARPSEPPPPVDPMPPQPMPPAPAFDSRGWTLIGERTVDGKVDSDKIDVSQKLGKFTKLTVVVNDSDLEMINVTIHSVNGKKFDPNFKHFFREGSRSRVIELTDGEILRRVDFKYRNLPGGGRASVQVWGWAPQATAPTWDTTGWTMLGERVVEGKVDTDKIDVSQKLGKFNRLMVVVLDSDLEMVDMTIHFVKGPTFNPKVNTYFRENTRTRAIDLPGNDPLRRVDFKYRNLPGGGRARVQVWGKLMSGTATAPTPTPTPTPTGGAWDPTGWKLIAEKTIDGKEHKIDVSQKTGKFTRVSVVVLDGDAEMESLVVHGVKGAKLDAPNKSFRDGARSSIVDLPAGELLRRVDLKARAGGKGRVQIWGR